MIESKPTPLQRYRQALDEGEFIADAVQEGSIEVLQSLHDALAVEYRRRRSWKYRLAAYFRRHDRPPVEGVYFWGGVGRGKTWLVDLFYDSLPFRKKLRMHFHRFMRRVHNELKQLHDQVDPLQIVADGFADEALVICFDEFYVTDITDAMLLGNLLDALFARGVTLVATSNEHPDELYRNGLQRDRFLPAVELIKSHTRIFHLDSGVDYRLRYLDSAEIFHHPLDEQGQRLLDSSFRRLAPDEGSTGETIEIEGRGIKTIRCADGVAWFDFFALCDGPRGAVDYIELGRLFQTVLIAGIPQLDDDSSDMVKRFITLIDEFYDRNVKVIITAATPIDSLYTGKRLTESFRRTASRLVEMQSREYLARGHLSD